MRVKFSLRLMIGIQTCFAVLLAFCVGYHRSAVLQESFAKELTQQGIIAKPVPVALDENNNPLSRREVGWISSLLEKQLGPHYAYSLERIIVNSPIEDSSILRGMNGVRSISGPGLDDEGVLGIDPDQLIFANLSKSPVSNRAIAHLSLARQLKVLLLDDCQIDDQDLELLGSMDHLVRLSANRTQVTGTFLLRTEFRSLQSLSLARCNISHEALAAISELRELRVLNLTRCKLSDEMFEEVVILPRLETLTLVGTDVTDKSLVHLSERFPALKSIDLESTHVSRDAIERMRCTYISPPAYSY
jgi:hypothetical protein